MVDEARRKQLTMRSWRRGIREMDLILGPYAEQSLPAMSAAEVTLYEALLTENDHDLYQWLTARIGTDARPGPDNYGPLLDRIAAHAAARLARP